MDSALERDSPCYRFRHWLRDGGLRSIFDNAFVAIGALIISITIGAVMVFGILAQPPAPKHAAVQHISNSKRAHVP